MRLAKGTDYAYRILMLVAMNSDRSLTVEAVASTLNLSRTHSMKLIAKLSSNGFLKTTRGRGGGLTLGQEATEIRLGDVARTMEADFGLLECLYRDESDCAMFGGCEMTFIMHRALKAFLDSLNEFTLEDIVKKSKNSERLILPACIRAKLVEKSEAEKSQVD